MSPPRRVVLVRTSSLGDVVHSLPVLAALRRAWPGSEIAWVVEEAYLPILEGHPDLARTLPVALRRWRRSPLAAATGREVGRFLGEIGDFGADLALDLMGSHKGGLLAALSFAPRRIGLTREQRREPSSVIWANETVNVSGLHAVDRQLGLLAALGVAADPVDFAPHKLFARHPAAQGPPTGRAGYVFLHPGAAWGNKRLPTRIWREVADGLRRASGLQVLVGAAEGERDLAAAIADGGVAEAVPALRLPELAGWIRGAALFLGGDTGPLHLAHALGTPVVSVMGPTDPARHGPYRRPQAVVVRRLPCSHCHRRMDSPRACLEGIEPGRVVSTAMRMLTWSGVD